MADSSHSSATAEVHLYLSGSAHGTPCCTVCAPLIGTVLLPALLVQQCRFITELHQAAAVGDGSATVPLAALSEPQVQAWLALNGIPLPAHCIATLHAQDIGRVCCLRGGHCKRNHAWAAVHCAT